MVTVPAAGAPADFVGKSIVLIGAFDPLTVQPANLADQGLLSAGDLAQLKYDVLAPEISVLRLPWMLVIIESNKMTASTTLENPLPEPVRDFVFALYAALPIKRLTAVGLNHDTHFAVSSEEVWHKIGHLLAPKEQIWRTVLTDPGTASLTIRGKRDDDLHRQLNVKVEPSLRIHPGIYVHLNDHFAAGEGPLDDPEHLIDLAGEQWARSMRRSDDIVAALKGLM